MWHRLIGRDLGFVSVFHLSHSCAYILQQPLFSGQLHRFELVLRSHFRRQHSVREHCYFFFFKLQGLGLRSLFLLAWFDSFWALQPNLLRGTSLWIIEKAQLPWAERHLRCSRAARRRPRSIVVQTARSAFRGALMTKPSVLLLRLRRCGILHIHPSTGRSQSSFFFFFKI